MKGFWKAIRWITASLLLLAVGLPVGVYVYVCSPWGQDRLKDVSQSVLTEILGVPVSVGSLSYRPLNTLSLHDVSLNDDYGKEALSARTLAVRFELWHFLQTGEFVFDYAVAEQPHIRLYQVEGQGLNIQPIIDRLSKGGGGSSRTSVQIGTVAIVDGDVEYSDGTSVRIGDLDLHCYIASGKQLEVDLESLRLADVRWGDRTYDGAVNLSANLKVGESEMLLSGLSLSTEYEEAERTSLLFKPIKANLQNLPSESVHIELSEPATIPAADLAFFIPLFENRSDVFTLSLNSDLSQDKATISRLLLADNRGFAIDIENGEVVYGDDLQYDIEKVALIYRGATPLVSVQAEGSVYGDLTSASFDLSVKNEQMTASIVGDCSTDEELTFDVTADISGNLGAYLPETELGYVDAHIEGVGYTATGTRYNASALASLTANLKAEIASLSYKGHDWHNVTIDLNHNGGDQVTDIAVTSADEAATFDLNATLSTETSMLYGGGLQFANSSLNLNANIAALDLAALNLTDKYPDYNLKGSLDAQLSGSSLDDCVGEINITDFSFSDDISQGLSLYRCNVSITQFNGGRCIDIASDFLNGSIEGVISPTTLPQMSLGGLLQDVGLLHGAADHSDLAAAPWSSPTHRVADQSSDLSNDFHFDFTVSNVENLSEFLNLPVLVIYPIEITGDVSSAAGLANITIDAPYLKQGDKIIDSTILSAFIKRDGQSFIYATSHMPTKKGPMLLRLNVLANNNSLDTKIDWQIERAIPIEGSINFVTDLYRGVDNSLCMTTRMQPGSITFGDDIWNIGASTIGWCNNILNVNDFSLATDTQSITIDGIASENQSDSILVTLKDIKLASIFENLEIDKALIGGTANGTLTARRVFSDAPFVTTDNLHVDSIGYNYCTLGCADIIADWDNENQAIFLDADITTPEGNKSRIWGNIFAAAEALDLNFDATRVRVGFMKPFMDAFTSDVTGYVSGTAHLFGTFQNVDMEGDIFAEDLRLKIDFTNTYYTATDSIHVRPGRIDLANIAIKDDFGHIAQLDGWLTHKYFHLPAFNFQVTEADNFLSYDVREKDSPIWFGRVFGTGSASVVGEPGRIDIGVKMATNAGSNFTFVLSDQLEAEQYSFITFVDKTPIDKTALLFDDTPEIVRLYQQRINASEEEKPSVYNMDIQVDITPEAQMIVVMDPIGGDKINAYGSGDIHMTYNSLDNDIRMWGRYELDRGDYNFTLQDIIIKNFTINPESSITFHGDPYAAVLDIEAVYQVNASLTDLDESFAQDKDLARTNIPVQALLKVAGDMRQPDISFDLNFPTLTSQDIYRKVRSIISTDEMMNRQIIYLLALNRFYTPDYMASTTKGSELFSVASSTISSQLSGMLGKLSDNWSIAPNLRSNQGDFSDLEVDVALSSRLLNNRLLLNGNFGYRDKSLNTNQFIGDFDIEYLLTPRGTWRLKAYNRYNDQNYFLRTATTTQGIGIIFRRDFDTFFPFSR